MSFVTTIEVESADESQRSIPIEPRVVESDSSSTHSELSGTPSRSVSNHRNLRCTVSSPYAASEQQGNGHRMLAPMISYPFTSPPSLLQNFLKASAAAAHRPQEPPDPFVVRSRDVLPPVEAALKDQEQDDCCSCMQIKSKTVLISVVELVLLTYQMMSSIVIYTKEPVFAWYMQPYLAPYWADHPDLVLALNIIFISMGMVAVICTLQALDAGTPKLMIPHLAVQAMYIVLLTIFTIMTIVGLYSADTFALRVVDLTRTSLSNGVSGISNIVYGIEKHKAMQERYNSLISATQSTVPFPSSTETPTETTTMPSTEATTELETPEMDFDADFAELQGSWGNGRRKRQATTTISSFDSIWLKPLEELMNETSNSNEQDPSSPQESLFPSNPFEMQTQTASPENPFDDEDSFNTEAQIPKSPRPQVQAKPTEPVDTFNPFDDQEPEVATTPGVDQFDPWITAAGPPQKTSVKPQVFVDDDWDPEKEWKLLESTSPATTTTTTETPKGQEQNTLAPDWMHYASSLSLLTALIVYVCGVVLNVLFFSIILQCYLHLTEMVRKISPTPTPSSIRTIPYL